MGYNLGDVVFFMKNNKVHEGFIKDIYGVIITEDGVDLVNDGYETYGTWSSGKLERVYTKYVFKTKQELLNSLL